MGKKISLVNDNPQCPGCRGFTVRWYNPFKRFWFVTRQRDLMIPFGDIFHFSVGSFGPFTSTSGVTEFLGTIIDRPDGRQICEVLT